MCRRTLSQAKVGMLSDLRALFSFFTVFPVRAGDLAEASRSIHLLPLAGLAAGIPGALMLMLGYALPAGVAATISLGSVLIVAGFHHTDGVLDVGDALMVRGSRERRRAVMKDERIGTGGLGALFLVYGPALAALTALVAVSPFTAAFALLASEVAVRSAMLLLLTFGKPAEEFSSAVPFIQALRSAGRRRSGVALSILLPPLIAIPFGAIGVLAVLAFVPAVFVSLRLAEKAFGGIGGDVAGATGEVARTVVLVVLSVTI